MTNVNKDHIQRLFAFHHWATDRVFEAMSVATPEQLDRKWGGSFGSGRALVRHVIGVERLWHDRWKGHSPKTLPEFPATHGGKAFRAEWESVRKDQQRFIAALTPGQLDGDLTFTNLKGETWTYPFADVLIHSANHGTYHRGQLTHLLRDLGISAPSTDYLLFVEGRKS